MTYRDQKPEVLVYFYKPLGKHGGDVDEVKRLIKDLSIHYSVTLRICAPIFWSKYSQKMIAIDDVQIQEFFVSWLKILLNVPKIFIKGLPLEFAFFVDGVKSPSRDYRHIICRGTRVFLNISESRRTSTILVAADSLGITWYRKSLRLNPFWSWICKSYSSFHLRTEVKFVKQAKASYFFDKIEARFFRLKQDNQIRFKVRYARMAWHDVSHLCERSTAGQNDVAVFGLHAASHNQNRLSRLSKFSKRHLELNFKIIGDLSNVDKKIIKSLENKPNIEIIGFIAEYSDLVKEISSCRFSYHCYDFVSGMQNTVLLAINLGQELICSKNINRAIFHYFRLETTKIVLHDEENFCYDNISKLESQSFNISYLSEFDLIEK